MTSKEKQTPLLAKFAIGGLSGMAATMVVQPLDLVKTRMQISVSTGTAKAYSSSPQVFFSILKKEGILGLYNGDDKPTSFILKALIGMTSGGIGAFVGNPTEVALIRMTADGKLPFDKRRNYKHAFNALARIVKEEGILSLWTGSYPTIVRAMVVNAAQLATYSQIKQIAITKLNFNDNICCHTFASLISGFDVIVKIKKREGFLSLWKGFTPYYARLGPHTIITFIVMEQLTQNYKKIFN
ncbi:Mitochondrial brown fat uncoupling protein 1 [Intoshia linei]|uniref:Mitochondrial brown fat uncoupling protein 1 n=1 Tax=Intoshia linei TaxID=1819745 RepID=A0A177ARP9_9BILA|nr:Mitochondrial brown fat uncoupling protein 1 [Intoshia linei]